MLQNGGKTSTAVKGGKISIVEDRKLDVIEM